VDSDQPSFTDVEYGNRRRVSRRERFLETMNSTIPWASWVGLIEPHYYSDRPGKKGRKAKPVDTMLRMYLLQVWFSLSDEGVEDAIYDSYAMRRFVGLDFAVEQVPDATTLLHFRHLLEAYQLGEKLLAAQNEIFEREGWIMRGGSIVDATIIAAPSSTKNATGTRDPEMHQTKKGNQWYFGMKAHVGVDAGAGYVHTVTCTRPTSMTSTRWSIWCVSMMRSSTAMPATRALRSGPRSSPTSISHGSDGASPPARAC
jgi:transposase, IS5 family